MDKSPFELFREECPELQEKFDELIEVQKAMPGLDPESQRLRCASSPSSVRTATPGGILFHFMMARRMGAKRGEVVGAVAMNLHLSGLAAVLDCLPSAVEGYEQAVDG